MSMTTALSASSLVTTPSRGAASSPVTMPGLGHGLGLDDAPLPQPLDHVGAGAAPGRVLEPAVDDGVGQPGGGREEPDQPVVAGGVDDDGGDVGQDHAAQVERGQQHADPFAEPAGPRQQLEQQRGHHDDVGPDERRADVAQDHRLPEMGVEVLHPGQHRPDQRRARRPAAWGRASG